MKKILLSLGLFALVTSMAQPKEGDITKCPFHMGNSESSDSNALKAQGKMQAPKLMEQTNNSDWWPNQLNLQLLRQNSNLSNPMDAGFNYAQAFNSLDYFALKGDIKKVLTQS